jgi:RNA polymerase sigma-70 factor (ECF subfamily)
MGLGAILAGLALSDEQAMWRVQTQDDHRAFAHLVEKWERPIRDLCVRMTGDVHRGEDVKQETFSRLYEKRRDYRCSGKFSSYLWRMALNLCYDELRKNRRHAAVPLQEETDQECGPDVPVERDSPRDVAARQEEAEIVREAIDSLPEIYRTTIILRHYENLKLREIAEVLDVPPGTINSRLAEGLTQLARRLEPHFAAKKAAVPVPAIIPRPPETSIL